MSGNGLTQPGFGRDGVQSHLPHQPRHPLRIDGVPPLTSPRRHPAYAVKWGGGVLLIEQAHQQQVLRVFPQRPVIESRACSPESRTLPSDTQLWVGQFDQRPLLLNRHDPLFFQPVELHLQLANLLV